MEYLVIFLAVIPFAMMAMAFVNLKLALSMYIMYIVCVPYLNINFLGIKLSYNLVHVIFGVAFLLEFRHKGQRIVYKESRPYILFFFTTFLLMLFQDRIPFSEQFHFWRVDFMVTLFVPFIIYNMSRYDCRLSVYLMWALFGAMLISGLYAAFLHFLPPGVNPYLMILAPLNGEEYDITYADDALRAIPRIFSTFTHPLVWCLFLSFFIISFWNYYGTIRKKFYIIILLLAFYDIVFCGVRTGMVALMVPFLYLFVKRGNVKILFYVFLASFAFILAMSINDTLFDYFYSIIDNSQTETKGSSMEMRLVQWEGCVEECEGREIIGNGYRWTDYYNLKRGNHPKAVTFESLLFVVYTNWGLFGFLVWGLFFYGIYIVNKTIKRPKIASYSLNAILIHYFIFSTLTGEYQYMRWFALFHSIIYSHFLCMSRSLKTSV